MIISGRSSSIALLGENFILDSLKKQLDDAQTKMKSTDGLFAMVTHHDCLGYLQQF
jgi:hypothetical protein